MICKLAAILFSGRWNKVELTPRLCDVAPGLILGLRPANERQRYFVTSLIGWEQT